MSKPDSEKGLFKFLTELPAARPGESSPASPREITRLVSLMVADRVRFPAIAQDSAGPGRNRQISGIAGRNADLLLIFPSFFAPLGNDWEKYAGLAGLVDNRFHNLTEEELFNLPGRIHQALMANPPSPDGVPQQKKQGSYYTPAYLVRYMVERCCRYILDGSPSRTKGQGFRALDPSCGGASFLIEIWRQLIRRGWSADAAGEAVFGIDTDQEAVDLCIYLLTVAVTAKSSKPVHPENVKFRLQKQIKTGNALAAVKGNLLFGDLTTGLRDGLDWQHEFPAVYSPDAGGRAAGFDLVIGNPPYVSNKLIPPQEKRYYQENYFSAQGQFDLAVPFLEQGLNLLKNSGILCYLTSNKFLAADYGKNLRQELLVRNRITDLVDVSTLKSFRNTDTYPVIIMVRKRKPRKTKNPVQLYRITSREELEAAKPVRMEQGFFRDHCDYLITTALNDQVLPIIKKIRNITGRIPQTSIKCGLAVPGFRRWVVKPPQAAEIQEAEGLYRPFIQAGHLKPYRIEPPDWIDTRQLPPARLTAMRGPKLVIPGIALTLTAAVDYSDSLLGRVYYVRQTETVFNLCYLAVLFNSLVLNFYYRVIYWHVHLAGGYLRFNSGYLANLPVYPQPHRAGGEQGKIVEALIELGDRLAGLAKAGEKGRDYEDLDLAEALVFSLYGLSGREAETVMQFLAVQTPRRDKISSLMKEGSSLGGKKSSR